MTHTRIFLVALFMFVAVMVMPSGTDAATNICQAFTSYQALPSKTSVAQCDQNFGTNVYCERASYTYNEPICGPVPDPWGGWTMGCADNWKQGYNYYYGPGPAVSGAYNQAVAYCPHYPNPTVNVSASPTSTAYGSTVTVSWSSTNATSCTSNDFNTNNLPSGSAQATVTSSGSSKTFSVTCTNGIDATATGQATVTISNPATPASCTAWDVSKTNATGPHMTAGGPQTPAACIQYCSNYSNQTGQTVTCGMHSYTETYGFGGPSYGGSSGSQTTAVSCTAIAGTTQYPADSGQYYTTTSEGGSMDTNDPNYWSWQQASGCFGPTPSQTCSVWGFSYNNSGATTCTFVPPAEPPTATLTANPTSIVQGNSSTLTWSSTNATSCTGTNFSTGGATSGSLSVAPGSTTNYSVTCTGPGGNASDTETVTVTPTITASCSASPTSITTGQSATWTATASGGNGSYLYAWSGSDTLSGTGPSITKTYTTTGTKLASVTVGSGGQSVTVGCTNSVSVSPTVLPPDLTAGATSVSPSSPTTGSSVTFSATASNIGSGASGSFPTRFQIANSAITSTIGNTSSSYITLPAGGSQNVSASYTFSSSGAYNVRACANQTNDGSTNIVTESNYGNNCGPWTQVTSCPSGQAWNGTSCAVPTCPSGQTWNGSSCVTTDPPNLSCNVSDTNVSVGESVTYTASGASSPFTWTASGGGSYGSGATASRTFSSTGSYTMTVSKSGYDDGVCPAVTVGALACTNPSASISANPTRVREGQTTSVTWTASGVDSSCTVTENGSTLSTISGVSCNIPNGSATRTITEQTVYRISCDGGEVTDEVVVNLIPAFIEF